jgi:hypothetical protein
MNKPKLTARSVEPRNLAGMKPFNQPFWRNRSSDSRYADSPTLLKDHLVAIKLGNRR